MTLAHKNVQRAIYSALTGDVTLMAKVTGVFDFIPDKQAYPFVHIGEASYTDFSTHTEDGFDGTIVIHVWHRPGARGRAPLFDIMQDVYRILHENEYVISGYVNLSKRFEFSEVLVDPDAVTYHGVMRFRLILGGN